MEIRDLKSLTLNGKGENIMIHNGTKISFFLIVRKRKTTTTKKQKNRKNVHKNSGNTRR